MGGRAPSISSLGHRPLARSSKKQGQAFCFRPHLVTSGRAGSLKPGVLVPGRISDTPWVACVPRRVRKPHSSKKYRFSLLPLFHALPPSPPLPVALLGCCLCPVQPWGLICITRTADVGLCILTGIQRAPKGVNTGFGVENNLLSLL